MRIAIFIVLLFILGCTVEESKELEVIEGSPDFKKLETATLAGGCFWCMEHPFEILEGVYEVTSGYSGGEEVNPTYEEVSSGKTGHAESVQILFDPKKISYKELLDVFWKQINPTDADGQFVDRGQQYRTAIFYHNKEQKEIAEKSKEDLNNAGKFDNAPIVTEITKFKSFYKAEDYHQDYYKETPVKYKFYRYNSGRDQFLKKIWD